MRDRAKEIMKTIKHIYHQLYMTLLLDAYDSDIGDINPDKCRYYIIGWNDSPSFYIQVRPEPANPWRREVIIPTERLKKESLDIVLEDCLKKLISFIQFFNGEEMAEKAKIKLKQEVEDTFIDID